MIVVTDRWIFVFSRSLLLIYKIDCREIERLLFFSQSLLLIYKIDCREIRETRLRAGFP